MAVLEPFAQRPPRRLALSQFTSELGARLEPDGVSWVDIGGRVVHTAGQRELPFDALMIAVGASTSEALPGAATLDFPRAGESVRELIAAIDAGSVRTLALVAPHPTWPLPVYEVALLCAEHARELGAGLEITILTAEQRPLGVFGDEVSAGVAGLLARADIAVIGDAAAERSAGGLIVSGGERELLFDRVVAIPRLAGPALTGLPANDDGFLPITEHGLVIGTDSVYAAGDASDFPVKFGAVAAQQADAAAAAIAAAAGAEVEPQPFDGAIHGTLLSGRDRGRLYFSARLERDGARDARVSDTPNRPREAKIAARYLGPYLDRLWAEGPRWLAGELAWEAVLARLEQ
jgi:sulfide:quinone oxidoreductase